MLRNTLRRLSSSRVLMKLRTGSDFYTRSFKSTKNVPDLGSADAESLSDLRSGRRADYVDMAIVHLHLRFGFAIAIFPRRFGCPSGLHFHPHYATLLGSQPQYFSPSTLTGVTDIHWLSLFPALCEAGAASISMKIPITFLTAGLIVIASRAHAMTIVRAGEAQAMIVVPARSKPVEALELQKYVEKVSGAKLEIVAEDKLGEAKNGGHVFVGPCLAASRVVDLKRLQPEGFVIKTEGNDLFIVGQDVTETGMHVAGTFYGVCEFLERYLGVRWLMEGPLGEVVPKQRTIEVTSADIRKEPVLCMRGNSSQHVAADQSSNAGSWSAHQRLGSRVKISTGHAFAGWWDKYHERYPEIFAMQPNGTRINTHERERLCESNPTLWKLVAEEKIRELRANPSLLAVSISENDGGDNDFCSCSTCRSWDSPETQERFKINPNLYLHQESDLISDRVYRFYNEVAKLVQKQLPDRYVSGYAYSVYQTGPARDYPDHSDNLIIGYVGFDSEEYLNDTARAAQRGDWLKWSKLTRHLFLRPNLLLQPISLPIIYVHKLAEDLRFMADHGMWGATYGSGNEGNWGTQGLDYYVLARMLWDPQRDVDQVIDDYCRAAYGPGATAMKEYYRRAEDLANRIAATGQPNRDLDVRIEKARNKLTDPYTDSELARLQACVDEAAAAIGSSNTAALERVGLVTTGLEYTKKTRDLLAAAAAVRAGKSGREDFNRIKAETDKYYGTLKGSLAVNISGDIQSCLSLTPDTKQ